MKTVTLIATLSLFSLTLLGQTQFKITFSNLKNDLDVKINYRVTKVDQSTVLIDSLVIPSRSRMDKIIRVRNNQILEVFPSSSNKLFLKVARTYYELKSTLPIEGNSPLNINIIQLENLKNSSIEVAQLMEELNTNGILQKLLDTTDVIIDNKIRIGSYLIYNETDQKYIEVFEPTSIWYDRKNVEIFNQNDEILNKTTTKNSIANSGINIPKIIKIGGKNASSDYFDFRWKVYNFREEKFGVTNETPQTLFKKYPNFTGYNLLKNLVLNGENKKYKVFFVSAWSLTDSIATFVDSYSGVDKKVEFDFNYPPSGTRVFGIDGKAAFKKANSELKASIMKNIYNYFEVSDITASSFQQINNDIQLDEERKRQEFRNSQLNIIDESLNKIESEIKGIYSALVSIDNKYIKTEDINVILQIPLFKQTTQEIPDTLSQEVKEKIFAKNLQVKTQNSFIEYLEAKKPEFYKFKNMKQEFVFSDRKMVFALEKQIDASVSIRKMTNVEFNALINFSKK